MLDGLRYGFNILDPNVNSSDLLDVECENYESVLCDENYAIAESKIQTELNSGNYVMTSIKPKIVSSLGAVPKGKTDIRLIHDCSRPHGYSLNDHATANQQKFVSIDTATALTHSSWYMCKVDLSSAYRHVPIHPQNYNATGIKWKFKGNTQSAYMYDTKLPFGARKSVEIFHRLSQSVVRMF